VSARFGKAAGNLELLDGFHNRSALDAALWRELRPGNRAEFRDGMYTIQAVAERIPASFAGTLDLTLCDSIFLAEGIKSRADLRQSLVLANGKPTPLKLRLLLYKHVILDVAATGREYRGAVRSLRTTLLFGSPLPMTRLKDVLQSAVAPSDVTLGAEDHRRLREALQGVCRSNERYFALLMVLLVACFFASWVLVFLNREDPKMLTAIFAVLGGSVFGGIWRMARLWQQKVATDIILATLDSLKPAERTMVWKRILEIL
jgi:hypothetical protein